MSEDLPQQNSSDAGGPEGTPEEDSKETPAETGEADASDPSAEESKPLISHEEADALVEAMQAGAEPELEVIKLGSEEAKLRRSLGPGDAAAKNIADQFQNFFLWMSGFRSETSMRPSRIVILESCMEDLSPCFFPLFRKGDAENQAPLGWCSVGSEIVSVVLDCCLGASLGKKDEEGNMQGGAGIPPRAILSPVERRILGSFLQDLSKIVSEAWCGNREEIVSGPLVQDPAFTENLDLSKPFLLLSVSASAPSGEDAPLLVWLDARGVELSSKEPQRAMPSRTRESAMLHDLVCETQVEIAAVLGRNQSSVQGLLAAEVGDILRLDSFPEKPAEIRVAGVPLFQGKPTIYHGNLAVEVTQILDAESLKEGHIRG